MAAPHKIERRGSPRFAVTGRLNCELSTAAGQKITYVLLDVSESGIGLVSEEELAPGEVLYAVINPGATEVRFEFRVVWNMRQTLEEAQVFRCGCALRDRGFNFKNFVEGLNQIFLEDLS